MNHEVLKTTTEAFQSIDSSMELSAEVRATVEEVSQWPEEEQVEFVKGVVQDLQENAFALSELSRVNVLDLGEYGQYDLNIWTENGNRPSYPLAVKAFGVYRILPQKVSNIIPPEHTRITTNYDSLGGKIDLSVSPEEILQKHNGLVDLINSQETARSLLWVAVEQHAGQ